MNSNITKGVVYCFENILDGKKYIGKTVNEKERLSRHKKEVKYCKRNSYFYNAIRKYGWENFKYYILCDIQLPNKKLVDKIIQLKEIEFISKYNTNTEGYNMTIGGDGAVGHIVSEATKLKLRNRPKELHPMWGKKSPTRKPILQYTLSGELVNEFESLKEAALATGAESRHISRCCNRQGRNATKGFVFRFKSDPDFEYKKLLKIRDYNNSGENNPNSKLKIEDVLIIREKYSTGNYTQKELGEEYGVKQAHISLIVREEGWKILNKKVISAIPR